MMRLNALLGRLARHVDFDAEPAASPLKAFARIAGDRVRYVKPHGALYNAIVHHEAQAAAVETVYAGITRPDSSRFFFGWPKGAEVVGAASDGSGAQVSGWERWFIGVDGQNVTLNSGRFLINLRPQEQRTARAPEIIERLKAATTEVAGIRLYLQSVQDLTIDTAVGATQYQVILKYVSQCRYTYLWLSIILNSQFVKWNL